MHVASGTGTISNEIHTIITFTNILLPTDSLFLAILLVKQNFKLVWPTYIAVAVHVLMLKHTYYAYNYVGEAMVENVQLL